MASTKKKRVSKKTKSSWRKHTNIKDVEDFLDEQRQVERIGIFSDIKNEELFRVDVPTEPKSKALLSEKKKRKANAKRPLRSLAALKNTSKVQDPIKKRNHVKQKKNGRNIEEEILYPRSQRHIQANKARLKYYNSLDKKLGRKKEAKEFKKDIWKEEDVRETLPGLKNDWISKDLSLHVLKNVGKPVVKVHDSLRHKTTKAKAFEAPHPGMSYNPSLVAHQALMNDVIQREEDIIKTEKHLKRVTTDMFLKVTPEERDAQRIREMSIGLTWDEPVDSNNPDEPKDDDGGDKPYKSVNPPVKNKKKPIKKKRKQKQQKKLATQLKRRSELKKLRADIHSLKKLKTEVEDEEEQLKELKKKRKRIALKKKFGTRRLGRLPYKEPDIPINMPEDIAGNLRNTKVETSLIVDRFKNFQKRNILPTTAAVGKRKRRKIKRFTRHSHKDTGVSMFKTKKL